MCAKRLVTARAELVAAACSNTQQLKTYVLPEIVLCGEQGQGCEDWSSPPKLPS